VAAGQNGVFEVEAYDVANGRQIWRWHMAAAAGGGITPPTATKDAVFVSVDSDGLYALGATDGTPLWHTLQGAMGTAVAAR
jgi:outer membrane protein assembly factor BamB